MRSDAIRPRGATITWRRRSHDEKRRDPAPRLFGQGSQTN